MLDIEGRIVRSFENVSTDPWFSELTEAVTTQEWGNLWRNVRLTPTTYGTSRILAGNASAPRLKVQSIEFSKTESMVVEMLSPKWIRYYRQGGTVFYSAREIKNGQILQSIGEALDIIKGIPTLMKTVGFLVRSLHVIKPPDAEHDVSFSEPHIPFTIFVSVSPGRYGNEIFRLAEAIVHEAMHLQLSLIEKSVTLCLPSHKRFFSPWRQEYRSANGVLHGLYVFTVINRFLEELSSVQDVSDNLCNYLVMRRTEITNQLKVMQGFQECADLTVTGSFLAGKLLSDYHCELR